ncbi:hypothetical protein [Nonomuraea typhae]|uniref:DUF222 domain-containing protein n=1 Tax=Nonomuraea typhae TaxID=2603600 RepID=A0ABW7YMV4_9ACTN
MSNHSSDRLHPAANVPPPPPLSMFDAAVRECASVNDVIDAITYSYAAWADESTIDVPATWGARLDWASSRVANLIATGMGFDPAKMLPGLGIEQAAGMDFVHHLADILDDECEPTAEVQIYLAGESR